MASNSEDAIRRMVPRWRPYREALRANELASWSVSKAPQIESGPFLEEKERAWLMNKSLPYALDFISAAIVLGGVKNIKLAAEFILESQAASMPAKDLAKDLLGISTQSDSSALSGRQQVLEHARQLKKLRINQPSNAFVWIDLARLYVLLGQLKPAQHALNVALALAPNERFILRSASRFFLHAKEPEKALALLRNNAASPEDPWLVAAEIAFSTVLNKSPKFFGEAKIIVSDREFDVFHTSELACALGSLEMVAGNTRKANKLFENSLRAPSENALAQVVWASRETGLGVVSKRLLQTPKAFEARTFDAQNQGKWSSLLEHAIGWIDDESFSSRPRMIASGTASSLLRQPERAEEIARSGLETHAGHPGLLNNMAFALVSQGRYEEAAQALGQIDKRLLTTTNAVCLQATAGLIAFRMGEPQEGRKLYELAIETAGRNDLNLLKTTAALYLAREDLTYKHPHALRDFMRAYESAEKSGYRPLRALANNLAEDIIRIVLERVEKMSPKDRSKIEFQLDSLQKNVAVERLKDAENQETGNKGSSHLEVVSKVPDR